MDTHQAASKITAGHLARGAYVYVRQSTDRQVQLNTAGATRQYNMVGVARGYGWPAEKVTVIDDDQGLSGTSTEKREGFKRLVLDIASGRVGAVLCLETSRLARDCADWQQLIKLCALKGTLIIDGDKVYDPRDPSDRLLLDFKGVINNVEVHTIKSRFDGGRLQRAREGRLRFCLPPGYVYSPSGAIIFDPDEEVQRLVRLLFDRFEALGTAAAAAKFFRANGIQYPTPYYDGSYHAESRMGLLTYQRVVQTIHNPLYAGIYVYQKTKTVTEVSVVGENIVIKRRTATVRPEDWPVVIHGFHEGYITEEQYQRNQRRLQENRFVKEGAKPGAARSGPTLLQGILRCGVCGKKLYIHYCGSRKTPYYKCYGETRVDAAEKCVSAPAARVDAEVGRCLLDALAPGRLEATLGALAQIEAQERQVLETGRAAVRGAELEAAKAGRLFKEASEENRLVRAELEREWNEALLERDRVKVAFEALRSSSGQGLDAEERRGLKSLLECLPELWEARTTRQQDRKELLRLMIRDILLARGKSVLIATIRFHTGARHEIEVPHPNYAEAHNTNPAIIDLIRTLALTHTDEQIARLLNENGHRPLFARRFRRSTVTGLRIQHGIRNANSWKNRPGRCDEPVDGRYTVPAAARLLGLSPSCIDNWCKSGKVDVVRPHPRGPRLIRLAPEDIPRLRKAARPRKRRKA